MNNNSVSLSKITDPKAYNTLDKALGCLHAMIVILAFTGNTFTFFIFTIFVLSDKLVF